MGNLDEKRIAGMLERIARMKEELDALADQVREMAATPAPAVEEAPAETPAPEPEPVAEEPVPTPVPVPEDLPEDLPEAAPEEPIDLAISDAEIAAAPAAEAPAAEIPAAESADEPIDIMGAEPEPVSIPEPEAEQAKVKTILDTPLAEKAVMDVMAEKQAWRTDRPGTPVKNIISAISLNDRVLLINTLFKEDPILFQETVSAFNAMGGLEEAVAYIGEHFPEWNLNTEPVYRLMMAVRRKLA